MPIGDRRVPHAVRAAFGALAVLTLAWVAWLATDFDAGPLTPFLDRWAGNVVIMGAAAVAFARAATRREERLAHGMLAIALLVWGIGDLYFRAAFWTTDDVPTPSLADACWLVFYLPAYTALGLLLRERVPTMTRALWVDGLIGALAVAAVAAAVLFEAVLGSIGGDPVAVATNLAYPLADMLLLALVIGALGMSGWRADSTWLWLAGGLATFALADSLYLYVTATGAYAPGDPLDAGWSIAAVVIAWAAWQPAPRRDPRPLGWRTIVAPIAFALIGLAVLVYDHFERVNVLALALASSCLLAVLIRLGMTFAQYVRMLERSRAEATTDALTGLGNRRRLMLDLEAVLREGDRGEASVLVLFDLDGFKLYNDTFGHPAGDALLARLGRALEAAVAEAGTAYRMGGDEFCVLAGHDPRDGERLAAAIAAALCEQGEGFAIGCSYGWVAIPGEIEEAADALRLADQRMYARKRGGRTSARRQSADVLVQALEERAPGLSLHLTEVAVLAEATAERLGLDPDEVERVRTTGQLHDVGKMAIPDRVLGKRGPLDEEEWRFVRRHTQIGERIVGAAPALAPVAPLIRSTHERWDGLGYPQGLRGREIPLASRIVAVCDAYHAMTSGRPYRAPIPEAAALDELRRCAGAQFDPDVVEAFCIALIDRAERVATI
jgi:two-component system, cell cycle response regulator